MRKTGTVIWFDPAKGFGFLTVEGSATCCCIARSSKPRVHTIRLGAILDAEIV